MRDVTSCVRKTSWTNESEVSSPVTDVSVLYVRVVVLGVLRRAVFWAEKLGSSVGAPALQASGRHCTTLVSRPPVCGVITHLT